MFSSFTWPHADQTRKSAWPYRRDRPHARIRSVNPPKRIIRQRRLSMNALSTPKIAPVRNSTDGMAWHPPPVRAYLIPCARCCALLHQNPASTGLDARTGQEPSRSRYLTQPRQITNFAISRRHHRFVTPMVRRAPATYQHVHDDLYSNRWRYTTNRTFVAGWHSEASIVVDG